MFPVCSVTYVAGLHIFAPSPLAGEGWGEGEAGRTHPTNRTQGEYSFHSKEVELPESTSENQGIDPKLAHSRWRSFSRQWIAEHKDDSLDISWLKDSDSVDAANLPEPSVLAGEAMGELVQALGELDALMRELGAEDEADGAKMLLNEILNSTEQ